MVATPARPGQSPRTVTNNEALNAASEMLAGVPNAVAMRAIVATLLSFGVTRDAFAAALSAASGFPPPA